MKALLGHIDELLRGRYTRREELREGRFSINSRTLVMAGLLLGGIYGLFMGIFAVTRTGNPSYAQLAVTMVKVPLLFLATLTVTFPSLYVFSALSNSRLKGPETLRLLLAAIAVTLALLASFGPVTGFFTLSTESYPFLVVLNVAFFAISGFAGLTFLRRAVASLFDVPAELDAADSVKPPLESEVPSHAEARLFGMTPPPLPKPRDPGRRVFMIWIVTYMIVGAQMGWILRPFIGSPNTPFSLLRPRGSNFFEALWHTLHRLFS